MFSKLSKRSLAKAVLFKNVPVYVQFYVTARCNLTCKQCNIIYSNSDVRECTISEIERIADNLAKLEVAIVLLTGGEPFIRHDLPDIIRAFTSRGIHVRMQTNGHASPSQIESVIKAGGRDISISLDSLNPAVQDRINGGFPGSWERAIRTMALFTECLPPEESFASIGCVIQRENLKDIPAVIEFGSQIGWFTSLVPVHVSKYSRPRAFQIFDQKQRLSGDIAPEIHALVHKVREMRREGFLLYDSDQYLDDICRYVNGDPTTWRDRNNGLCDTPNLYFAILPNGQFAPCCDYRIQSPIYTFAPDFPEQYFGRALRDEAREIASKCDGCMYGSYPEMTIAMRYLMATLQRTKTFFASPPKKPWPITGNAALQMASDIRERTLLTKS